MKIHFDIDATPEELRAFLGLPDVKPLQDELMEKVRERMLAGLDTTELSKLMQPLLPEHLRNIEALQKHFWEAFSKRPPREGGEGPGSS